MNPPPSYQEILHLLNTATKNEIKLVNEINELKDKIEKLENELESTQLELKIKSSESQMFYNAYTQSKKMEFKLEKIMSKL
jgi:hypothetical protein